MWVSLKSKDILLKNKDVPLKTEDSLLKSEDVLLKTKDSPSVNRKLLTHIPNKCTHPPTHRHPSLKRKHCETINVIPIYYHWIIYDSNEITH